MATVLLCAASAGSAQTAPAGKAWSYGPGGLSCGTWLDAGKQESVRHQVHLNWVLGWLTAAGAYSVRGELRETDANAVAAWVDKYCRENPLNYIKDAAASLVDELSKPQ
jgi:hypothetical protein